MDSFAAFVEECDRAPRLNQLAGFFASTAAGKTGQPIHKPRVDRRLFESNSLLEKFIELHSQRCGPFDLHYHSSIPYRLEEECRLGAAILSYGLERIPKNTSLKVYTLGTAEGTMARIISELADGAIETLSCSPNRENFDSFCAYGMPSHALFFLGSFHRLTKETLRADRDLVRFEAGFDIILEDTTFQMYSANRVGQIEFVSQHLKPDGLFLFVEKFHHDCADEYAQRERQKDYGFKARFFQRNEIENKARDVLTVMSRNQCTLSEMAAAISRRFTNCCITWNSGNFYTLVAGNNIKNIERLILLMGPPAIPNEYVYVDTPSALAKFDEDKGIQ